MTHRCIYYLDEPKNGRWLLGSLETSDYPVGLLGWNVAGQVDGGYPAELLGPFAEALASTFRVTFLSSELGRYASDRWAPSNGDFVRGVPSLPILRRWLGGSSMPRSSSLVSTTDVSSVARAFDDGGFPWSAQGQCLFLSARDEAPPALDRKVVELGLSENWLETLAADPNLLGLVRPGVDGDLAGLAFRRPELQSTALRAMKEAFSTAGCEWKSAESDAELADLIAAAG